MDNAVSAALPVEADVGSAHGSAGSLVIMLVWIYYSAQIVLFGAEFTQVYANEMGSRIVPTDKAVLVDQEKSDSMEPAPAHSRPHPAVGCLAPATSFPPQPEEHFPWWGTILLVWVAVTRLPRRSE